MSTAQIDWDKGAGLVPAIVQHAASQQVLMLGYMNAEALAQTQQSGLVTFFSRSKNRLWVKGETSGHTLKLVTLFVDCDGDTILVKALPQGPVCHTGTPTCFADDITAAIPFLADLAALVQQRKAERPAGSYTTSLFDAGAARVAQKVGEEGVELALARMKDDKNEILNEAADLLFHTIVLLADAGLSLEEACAVLQERHKR